MKEGYKTPKFIRDLFRRKRAEKRAEKREERRAAGIVRTYYVIAINCDCGSDIIVRTGIRYMLGPRCPGCRQIVGPMQWNVLGTVRAIGEFEAFEEWRRKKKEAK